MKIYTKKGDSGETSLIGGTRVSKSSLRIETYGTVDELNSYIGWLRDLSDFAKKENDLLEIQDRLFTIGASLASDPERSKMKIPEMSEEDIVFLENKIDEMDSVLPEMKSFVLPGGHPSVSCCHVARCVCRRAERLTVELSLREKTDSLVIKYLNRLSDYLFVYARFMSKCLNVTETPWKPRTRG